MPVIITIKSILKVAIPPKTPIVLNNMLVKIMKGLIIELNCVTRIRRISARAIRNALLRKAMDSCISSCSPVNL